MLSYLDFTGRFGQHLFSEEFQAFLYDNFSDLTTYNVVQDNYIVSEISGLELGFTNDDAVFDEDDETVFDEGHPIFSHVNIYPKTATILRDLPFNLMFSDNRTIAQQKAGQPTKTNQGNNFFGSPFLIDHYKIGNIVVSIDYHVTDDKHIEKIQIRDNDLNEHIKL